MNYLWSDAWILLATTYAGKENPATLSEVIAAADFIQHAIVTYEEMEGALARLTAGDYIVDRDGKFSPSDKTISYYLSITKPRRPVFKEEEDIEKFLGAVPWSPNFKPQNANQDASYPSLTRNLFNKAFNDYLSKFPKLTGIKKKEEKPNNRLKLT